jgi:hypothetical protein
MSEPVKLKQIHKILRSHFHEVLSSTDLLSITEWYCVKELSGRPVVTDWFLKFTREDVDPMSGTGFFEFCLIFVNPRGIYELHPAIQVKTLNHCLDCLEAMYDRLWTRALLN